MSIGLFLLLGLGGLDARGQRNQGLSSNQENLVCIQGVRRIGQMVVPYLEGIGVGYMGFGAS